MTTFLQATSKRQHGVSLVGLLMIVVVLGALTATAVVGVSSLTGSNNSVVTGYSGPSATGSSGSGGSAGSAGQNGGIGADIGIAAGVACTASAEAARSASTSYFVSSNGQYPVKWADLTGSNPPLYKPPVKVVVNPANPAELDGPGWKLTMTGGGPTEPTFACAT
jgi:hypothetical protein